MNPEHTYINDVGVTLLIHMCRQLLRNTQQTLVQIIVLIVIVIRSNSHITLNINIHISCHHTKHYQS